MSLSITISPASFATSVPLPIANPTSAFLSAGESFTPSPVIPTTKLSSCDNLTSLLLSPGRALAITRILGKTSLISSSVIDWSSLEVRTTSSSAFKSPASFAIATAVSFLSPVIIITCIPASLTSLIAVTDSGLISSRSPTTPISVSPPSGSPVSSISVLLTANARTLIILAASSSIFVFNTLKSVFTIFPFSSKQESHLVMIFSGAPLIRVYCFPSAFST